MRQDTTTPTFAELHQLLRKRAQALTARFYEKLDRWRDDIGAGMAKDFRHRAARALARTPSGRRGIDLSAPPTVKPPGARPITIPLRSNRAKNSKPQRRVGERRKADKPYDAKKDRRQRGSDRRVAL